MPSIQRVHDTYRSAMNSKNSHSDASFRRAEALEQAGKRDLNNKNPKNSFKDILQQKMEAAARKT